MENSIYQMVEEKLKVEKEWIEKEWKLRETMIREELKLTEARIEKKLRKERLGVEEKIKVAKTRISTEILTMMRNRPTSAENSMKLQFMNKISQPILTGEELKAEGNTCIQVSLVNNSTGNVVEVGPESSASVEIVVLKKDLDPFDRDDWTAEEFNEQIVHEVQGKKPLLQGNVHVKLQSGRGAFGEVKFKHHVMKMKPRPEFRLGARIVDDGSFVKEAKTESFIVKDFRNKYYKKHEIPSLSDEVWRLRNIRKGGKIDQRLEGESIYTVEGFLIRLLRDPQGLKNVVRLGLRKWEAIVKHARTCPSGNRRYCYINSQQKTGIVFDILGQILGLYPEGQYSAAINMLSENKADADELLSSAINHWEDVVSFDDEDSVNQYFTGTRMSIDDSNLPGISQSHGQYYRTEETPTNISNSSFQGTISNSTREIGSKDLFFPLGMEYMEIWRDSPNFIPSPNLDFEYTPSRLDWEVTNDNRGMQRYECFVDETNAESGILVVEPSEVVIPVCEAPKRWRMLFFCVKIVMSKKNGTFYREAQDI